jgi:hypothetical protein
MLGIKFQFLGHMAHNLVAVPAEHEMTSTMQYTVEHLYVDAVF